MTSQIDKKEPDDWGEANANSPRPQATTLHITKDNKFIYQIGVIALALIAVGTLGGIVVLSYQNKEIPGALVALGSAAMGALSGLFARN